MKSFVGWPVLLLIFFLVTIPVVAGGHEQPNNVEAVISTSFTETKTIGAYLSGKNTGLLTALTFSAEPVCYLDYEGGFSPCICESKETTFTYIGDSDEVTIRRNILADIYSMNSRWKEHPAFLGIA